MTEGVEFYLFQVDTAGAIEMVPVSTAVSRAYDLMVADRLGNAQAASLAMAAERSGKDPVAFARRFVDDRRAARGMPRLQSGD